MPPVDAQIPPAQPVARLQESLGPVESSGVVGQPQRMYAPPSGVSDTFAGEAKRVGVDAPPGVAMSPVPRIGQPVQSASLPQAVRIEASSVQQPSIAPVERQRFNLGAPSADTQPQGTLAASPRPRIEAIPQQATAQSDATMSLPLHSWHEEHLSSGDPVKAEKALQDIIGPAYADIAPGQRQQLLNKILNEDTSPHKGKVGWGERIVHGLKTFGLTTLITGNPFLGAAAGVWGGADPNVYHRLKHSNVDVPRATADAAIENQGQVQDLHRAEQYGQFSGVDPYTGKQTETARDRTARLDETTWQHQHADADRDATREQRDRIANDATKAKRRRDLIAIERSGMGNEQTRRELAEAAGISSELREPFIRGDMSFETDSDSNIISLSKRTGTAATVKRDGKDVKSFKATALAHQDARTKALIAAGVDRQIAEAQVRKEIAQFNADEAMKRAKLPPKRGGSRGSLRQRAEGTEAIPAPSSGQTKSYSSATLKAYADKYTSGDTEAAKRRIESENPGVRFEFK